METVSIEGIDVPVSRVGLGTWAMGGWMWGGSSDDDSMATIDAALAHGINLIDTAPAYGQGRAEEVVGRALARNGQRHHVVIATKAGLDWNHGAPRRDSSRVAIIRGADASLRRLRTDHIDLLQVHWPDPRVPIEETAQAMLDLLHAGKIRAIGVSNFDPAMMDAFREVAPLDSQQPPYNLFERAAERDVLPYAGRHGQTTLTYGALCRGLLSGRMRASSHFAAGDLRSFDPKFQPPRYAQYLRAVDDLHAYAAARGKDVLRLAVRWVLDRPNVNIALWGARRPAQVEAVDGVFGWHLGPDERAEIERIVKNAVRDPVGPEFMAPPDGSNIDLATSERKGAA
jgi:aryl-alcohol dehydrogenase-like predicted oxidoreductase